MRWQGKALRGLAIHCNDAVDEALGVLMKRDDWSIVQDDCAMIGGSLDEVNEQAGVVELSIVIDHTATQSFLLQRRQTFQCLFARESSRFSEAILSGEQVVDLQPDAVERSLP